MSLGATMEFELQAIHKLCEPCRAMEIYRTALYQLTENDKRERPFYLCTYHWELIKAKLSPDVVKRMSGPMLLDVLSGGRR